MNFKSNLILTAAIIIVLFIAFTLSACADSLTVDAVKVPKHLVIDGQLKEASWQQAKPITDFTILGTNNKAKYQTTAYVCYDDTYIYIGFKCLEPNVSSIHKSAPNKDDSPFPKKRDGSVFGEDHIEIMLDPTSGKTDYFQFAVGSGGKMWDCSRGQAGLYENVSWDGDWNAASYIGNDYWSCEAAIPYYTLGINPNVKNSWRINLIRHKVEPQELSSIASDGSFNNVEQFAVLKNIDANFSRFLYKMGALDVSTESKDGKLYTALQIPVTNNSDAAKDLKLQCLFWEPAGNVVVKSKAFSLKPGEKTTCKFEPFALKTTTEGPTDCDIVLSEAKSKDIVSYLKEETKIKFRPLQVEMIEPFYRNSIYATQKVSEVKLKVKVDADAGKLKQYSVKVDLTRNSDSKLVESTIVNSLTASEFEVKLPTRKLEIGLYTINVKLLDTATNLEIDAVKQSLSKLAPFKGEVRIDSSLNLLVDGKLFLVNGYCSIDENNMAAESKKGVNSTHSYGSVYWKPEDGKAFLDKTFESGLRVITYPWANTTDLMSKNMRLSESERQGITTQVNLYKNNPGLLGWYMHDEPELYGISVDKMRDAYELIKELDPYHPCVMLNDTLQGIDMYGGCADVLMPDPYPQFNKSGFVAPITKVSAFMDKIKQSFPSKMAWVALQAFDYGDDSELYTQNRGPNFNEFRAMVYLTTIHGVKGFLHFAYPYAQRYSDLRDGIPFITQELNYLAPAIGSPLIKDISILPEKSEVEAIVKILNGKTYVIAVNTSSEPKKVTLKSSAFSSTDLNVMSEGRKISAKGGAFTDQFESYGVHIYTTSNVPKGEMLSQVQAKIDAQNVIRRKKGNLAVWMDNDIVATASSWTHNNLYDVPRMVLNGVIDDKGKEGWFDSTVNVFPDWIQLTWQKTQAIGKIALYGINLKDYDVQYWNGTDWTTIEAVKGNDKSIAEFKFSPVQTDKIRVWITGANGPNSIISEIECY